MKGDLSQEVHLIDYMQLIARYKFLVLACLLVTLTTVLIYNRIAQPIYESRARILIDAEQSNPSLTGVTMPIDIFQFQSMELQTHFDLIVSFPILERVYSSIFLEKKEAAEPTSQTEETISIVEKIISFILENSNKALHFVLDLFPKKREVNPFENNPDLLNNYRIRSLRKSIDVQQVKKTRLIDLRGIHKNPQTAMNIANAVAQSYIEYTRYSSFEASKIAIEWLTRQMEDMKKEINATERQFYEFKQKENIFSIEGKQRLQVQNITVLNSSFSETKSKRMAIAATIKEVRNILDTRDYDKVALGPVGNPLLNKLHSDLVSAEIELAGLNKIFTYKHAHIIELENKIAQIKETFEQELRRTLSSLQSEYDVLQNQERTLVSSIQQYETDALNFTRKEMQYSMLEREVEANKKLYDLLFNNFTEANVIKAMPTTNIRLIEPAILPVAPVKPDKTLNLIIGTVLGLMVGFGLALFLSYLDRAINTPQQVELYLELPVLSVIPKLSLKKP